MSWETRSAPLQIRAEPGEDGNVRITLAAAVFNQRSVDLGGFVEEIEPGFFRNVLDGDTVAVWDHDDAFVLGRTTASPPTLSLRETADELEAVILAADNPRNRDYVLTPIDRGEVRHASFKFRIGPGGDEWSELPDGRLLRRLLPGGCADLADVSPVTRGAYLGTDAALRSGEAWRELQGTADPARAEALRRRGLRLRGELISRNYR